jgi:hypothetical protein
LATSKLRSESVSAPGSSSHPSHCWYYASKICNGGTIANDLCVIYPWVTTVKYYGLLFNLLLFMHFSEFHKFLFSLPSYFISFCSTCFF